MKGLDAGAATIPFRWFDELDSTNAETRRLAEAGELGPVWIAARRQSAGRGRRGNIWETGAGNLAATLLIRTDRPPGEAAQLSFVTALAVGDLARAFAPPDLVAFKWPNDVLLAGAKLSGILIESGRAPDGSLWLAIGVGVNLVSAPAPDIKASTLADHLKAGTAAPPIAETALAVLSTSLAERIAQWTRSGFEPVRAEWLASAAGMGARCTARLGQGTLHGVAEGLDIDGALLLRLDDGAVRRITAGDVFFGEP